MKTAASIHRAKSARRSLRAERPVRRSSRSASCGYDGGLLARRQAVPATRRSVEQLILPGKAAGRWWARSMHRRNSQDGNTRSTRPSHAEETPCVLQPICTEVGPQQSELDQIVLRATAANALVFSGERRKRPDRSVKIPELERRKPARQCGKIGTRRITPLSRQGLHLARPRVERGLIAHDGLRQDDMQVGEPVARPRK